MGKIQAIALNNRMIYAGASFFHVNEQSAENPINETDIPIQLSGSLNTFMDKERMVSPIVDYIHTIVLSNESIIASNATTIKVSDSGGTEIIVTGTGFNGNIRAYWFKIFLNGIPDYHQLQVNFINTTTFSVMSPICQHGQSYQLMIQKTETQENVQSHTLLHGIDDTAPNVLSEQPLSYLTPLKLVFSEPVTTGHFSVISEFMTYTGSETTDVSHWFDLFVNENTLTLHLKTHMALKHNRAYHIQINGINDLHGNIPFNWETITGGNYASFISGKDTLPPSQLSLIRQLDGQIVNLGMQLTRNKTYTFIPSAIDNMTSANDLAYHVRISRDGGLTFGDFQIILNQKIDVFIERTDTKIVFLLKVTDKAGYVAENRFEAVVCQENIQISSLYTAPHPSEERSNVHICFDLSGDIDLISQAELQIAEQPYALAQFTQQNSQQLSVCSLWMNPAYDVFSNNEIPVRLKLTIGQSDHKYIVDSYFIQKDSTPPIVSMVSPPDGTGIPVGLPTIIVVQAFDTFDLHNHMLFSCNQNEQLLADIIILPKLNQTLHCLLFAVNSLTGGYEIRYPDGVFYSKTTGQLTHLSFTGTGILAVEKNGQTNHILFWPINGEISNTPVTYNLTGKLIGSAGNTIFLKHGALFDAIKYDSKSFIPIAGKNISSPVTMARVDCGRLYILTENALHAFQTNESLSLTQVFMTHMDNSADGFSVSSKSLILWSDTQIKSFSMENDGHLMESAIMQTRGVIQDIVMDHDLILVKSCLTGNDSLELFKNQQCVGLISPAPASFVFTDQRMISQTQDHRYIFSKNIILDTVSDPFDPTLTETPLAVMISTQPKEIIDIFDSNQRILPAYRTFWQEGIYYKILREHITENSIYVKRYDRNGE
ncbi:IPT/TIG domain-containing protein, partial [Candidatus Magnetomorum sp. HK-1]